MPRKTATAKALKTPTTSQGVTPATAALTTPPAPAISRPVFEVQPCFVCQSPTINKHHNGRCRPCWEFFRATGTDRPLEEVAATDTTPAQEIISKGLLQATLTLKAKGKAQV